MHPSGRFLFGSNRGHDSIAIFSINEISGEAVFIRTVSAGCIWPRNFAITHDGDFMLVAG